MPEKLKPSDFISASSEGIILDVRSPGEYERAHIPGAISFPMFSNEERAAVGTYYKKEGKDKAVELGLSIVGPKLAHWVKSAKKIAQGKPLLVHCWRGGMRSGSMAWLLETAGLEVKLLIGGYKAYRHWVLQGLSSEIPLSVLGGKTGSGKTEILLEMKKRGFQVIDLEGLAHHRGSAFGHLGLAPQPSSEQFENLLFHELRQLDFQKKIWVEDESRHIGKVFMNLEFYNQLRNAPVLFLDIEAQFRLPYLVKVYAQYSKEMLAEALEKIKKRLGGQHYQKAIECLTNDQFEEVAAITLHYYDKAYVHGLSQREPENIYRLEVQSLETAKQVEAIVQHIQSTPIFQ
ncbi:tRNA 2-selenouridine(34) synthase MnmH [Aquirufa rosea]|uniref:tRNA 2-selenouridine(34) synthase MnmH n=1 Tax=Aquirufa rosea TaxID=2509241 RepID=A0A4Q1BYT3_9BACT|nr:tRNA 2-selenouridine(34) synthase MnmH [Aquirufa rosea]RXK48239.1 tRNA 2-selenouridine(34) synthase MnmH [Aquirufa rosea]